MLIVLLLKCYWIVLHQYTCNHISSHSHFLQNKFYHCIINRFIVSSSLFPSYVKVEEIILTCGKGSFIYIYCILSNHSVHSSLRFLWMFRPNFTFYDHVPWTLSNKPSTVNLIIVRGLLGNCFFLGKRRMQRKAMADFEKHFHHTNTIHTIDIVS